MEGIEHETSTRPAADEPGWAIPGVTPGLRADEPGWAAPTAADGLDHGDDGVSGRVFNEPDSADAVAARVAGAVTAVTAAAADGDGPDLLSGLTTVVAGIRTATAGLERVWAIDGTLLSDCLITTEWLTRRAASLRLALMRAMASRAPAGAAHPDAATRQLLQDACHASPARASQDVSNARLLDPDTGVLKRLGAALAAGEVTAEHVDVARRCLKKIPAAVIREHGDQLDELLTEHARRYHPKATRELTNHLLDMMGIEHSTAGKDRGRFLSLTHANGATHLTGQLDEATGRQLEALINAIIASNHHGDGDGRGRDWDSGDARDGGDGGDARGGQDSGVNHRGQDAAGGLDRRGRAGDAGADGAATGSLGGDDANSPDGIGTGADGGVDTVHDGHDDSSQSPSGEAFGIPDLRGMGEKRADAMGEISELAANYFALVRDPQTGEPATTGLGGQLNRKPSQAVPRLVLHLQEDDTATRSTEPPDGSVAEAAGPPETPHHRPPAAPDDWSPGTPDANQAPNLPGRCPPQDAWPPLTPDHWPAETPAERTTETPADRTTEPPAGWTMTPTTGRAPTAPDRWPAETPADRTTETPSDWTSEPDRTSHSGASFVQPERVDSFSSSHGADDRGTGPAGADQHIHARIAGAGRACGPPVAEGAPLLRGAIASRWARFLATTDDLARFDPHLTDREACDALIDLARFDGRGRLISLTSIGRLASPQLSAAVIARDRCCTFPSCTRPPSMCHVHHIVWHRNGGPTELSNLGLLCGPHHRLIHAQPRDPRDRWQMAMIDGIPHVQAPRRMTPSGLDEPSWLRNTYPLDLTRTRATARQLALTLSTG